MRHLASSSASCRRSVGLKLSRYNVLGSLRFGFHPDCRPHGRGAWCSGSRLDADAVIDATRMRCLQPRYGFTPKLRAEMLKKFKALETKECPFANLPERKAGRWGAGLTAAKMEESRWLRPELVGQFEFVEWTGDNHLRHSRFIALREDKKAKDVTRE